MKICIEFDTERIAKSAAISVDGKRLNRVKSVRLALGPDESWLYISRMKKKNGEFFPFCHKIVAAEEKWRDA
jgi:hypothetical protein